MNKSYFRFLVRYHRVPLVFFFIFYMTIALSSFMTGPSLYAPDHGMNSILSSTFTACMVMSVLLTFGIPIYLFTWMHTKKSCDVYGALPYTRKEMLITSMTAAFLVCFGFFFLGTIIPAIIGLAHGELYLSGYLIALAEMALGSAVLLLFNTGLYLVANNALDGVVMLGAYHFLPVMIMLTAGNVFSSLVAGLSTPDLEKISWLSPVYTTGSLVGSAISDALPGNLNVLGQDSLLPRTLILIGFLLVSILLLKANYLDRRLERAEQLSDNTLAYPLVIRIYTALCLLILAAGTFRGDVEFMMFILIFAAFLVSQFVYRRTIRPSWKMIIQFLILTASAFAIAGIGWQTKGFFMAERPIDYSNAQSISYYTWNDDDEGSVTLEIDLKVDDSDTKAAEMLDKLRQKSIDEFYGGREEQEDDLENQFSSYGTLSIETDEGSWTYDINAADALSIDDLCTLAKYGTLSIDQYSYSSGMEKELTLDEYRELIRK